MPKYTPSCKVVKDREESVRSAAVYFHICILRNARQHGMSVKEESPNLSLFHSGFIECPVDTCWR